ncbi:MAG: 6-bladed beta-propeller [Deltaproteobacteria bacterium]|nr:6-bladed beta-propeller [Deltaproteobacteria bacterium]
MKKKKDKGEAPAGAGRFLWVFWTCLVLGGILFSVESPLSELYRAGELRLEQDLVLDDRSMPEGLFFDDPSMVFCDPEGCIYVVDSGALNIKKFDHRGEFLRIIGREGQGPGEFGGLYYATFAKDRLVAWDSGNRRLCTFSPDGEFIHSIYVPYEEGWIRKLRGLPTGEVVVEMEKSYRQQPERPQECTILLYTSGLKLIKTIYERPLWRKKYVRTKEYCVSTLYLPFSPDVRWEVTPEGRMVIGFSARYALEVFDRHGNKMAGIAHEHEPARVTDRDKKAYFDRLEFYRMGEKLKDLPDYVTKLTQFPKNKPAYKQVLVDGEGNIWVVLNKEKQDELGMVFDAFTADGEFISRVKIPEDVRFPQNRHHVILHGRSLLLLRAGEDGLYRVIRYGISS